MGQRPKIGDKVKMVGVMNDPDPLPVGLHGTVTSVTPPGWGLQQYGVKWENNRTLMLLPHDPYIIIEQAQ